MLFAAYANVIDPLLVSPATKISIYDLFIFLNEFCYTILQLSFTNQFELETGVGIRIKIVCKSTIDKSKKGGKKKKSESWDKLTKTKHKNHFSNEKFTKQ